MSGTDGNGGDAGETDPDGPSADRDAPDAGDEAADAPDGDDRAARADSPETETGIDREGEDGEPDVPDWEDEYLDRVSGRLMFNYDLEKDFAVADERFEMYGRMEMTTQKHFFHPALSYAEHQSNEHLFATRRDRVSVADLERYVDLAHDLSEEWIDADEEHYWTDFTFVVVAEDVPDEVRSFVSGFKDRTMIKYGYHGQYEIHLAVVAPSKETAVESEATDIGRAFALWKSPEEESSGLLDRLF